MRPCHGDSCCFSSILSLEVPFPSRFARIFTLINYMNYYTHAAPSNARFTRVDRHQFCRARHEFHADAGAWLRLKLA